MRKRPGTYDRGLMKKILFLGRDKEQIINNPLHTIFMLKKDSSILKDMRLLEPIEIAILDEEEGPLHLGLGQVVSIKECPICEIEPKDFERQKIGYRNRKETLTTFRDKNPEFRGDINLDTEIVVVTLRRFDYNLKTLKIKQEAPTVEKMGKKVR